MQIIVKKQKKRKLGVLLSAEDEVLGKSEDFFYNQKENIYDRHRLDMDCTFVREPQEKSFLGLAA